MTAEQPGLPTDEAWQVAYTIRVFLASCHVLEFMREDPRRDEILAALSETDRERFLTWEAVVLPLLTGTPAERPAEAVTAADPSPVTTEEPETPRGNSDGARPSRLRAWLGSWTHPRDHRHHRDDPARSAPGGTDR